MPKQPLILDEYDSNRNYFPNQLTEAEGKLYKTDNEGNTELLYDQELSQLETLTNGNVINRLTALEGFKEDMLYVPVEIVSFTNSAGNVEIGSSVEVVLSFTLNKLVTDFKINGTTVAIPLSLSGTTKPAAYYTQDTTFTAVATDSRGNTSTKTTSIKFYNRIYYGIAEEPQEYNSAFILGLYNKVLSGSKARTISVNPGVNQYIFYCVPSRLGHCNFQLGGFSGGFEKVDTIAHTNASGYVETYDIYKSDNDNLGLSSIVVS